MLKVFAHYEYLCCKGYEFLLCLILRCTAGILTSKCCVHHIDID